MIVTEEEARTKRCQESYPAADGLSPHGLTEVGAATTFQTLGAGTYSARQTAPSYCIGSACMAWRWWGVHTVEKDGSDDDVEMSPAGMPRELEPKDDSAPIELHNLGYCGKASRP